MWARQDANATTVAVNGVLSEHPNTNISLHNNETSPLLRLPLELRLQIYELAVKESQAIWPRQVTKGSNLFVWGHAKYARHHPGLQEYSWVQTDGNQLTVTALLATCKAIYDELRERPVFYRVNTFKFNGPRGIHDYLAALTPARRNAIRNIVCTYQQRPRALSVEPIYYREFDDVLPILAYCQDLRSFKVLLRYSRYDDLTGLSALSNPDRNLQRHRQMILRVKEDNGHDATFWSLPSLSVECETENWYPERVTQELMDFQARFRQAVARRQRAANRTDLKACFTPRHMQRAVQKARVDLVGEVRLTRDRGEADDAPIARRTRGQKKAKQTVNEYGTLVSPIGPKYDFNGHIQWDFARIEDVRWSSHTIECQVTYFSNSDIGRRSWPPSYEPVHVLGTEYALERLRVYYQSFTALPVPQPVAVEQRIQKMQSMPSPRDCAQEHPELMTHKLRRSTWKTLQTAWVKTIGRLQTLARHLESQDRAKLGGEGEEVQPAEVGDKREAENTIHCAAPPSKKART